MDLERLIDSMIIAISTEVLRSCLEVGFSFLNESKRLLASVTTHWSNDSLLRSSALNSLSALRTPTKGGKKRSGPISPTNVTK